MSKTNDQEPQYTSQEKEQIDQACVQIIESFIKDAPAITTAGDQNQENNSGN